MTDTELSDDGWYACTAINSKGSKESKVYLQILKDPLKVRILLTIELEDRPLILNWEKNPGRTPY